MFIFAFETNLGYEAWEQHTLLKSGSCFCKIIITTTSQFNDFILVESWLVFQFPDQLKLTCLLSKLFSLIIFFHCKSLVGLCLCFSPELVFSEPNGEPLISLRLSTCLLEYNCNSETYYKIQTIDKFQLQWTNGKSDILFSRVHCVLLFDLL